MKRNLNNSIKAANYKNGNIGFDITKADDGVVTIKAFDAMGQALAEEHFNDHDIKDLMIEVTCKSIRNKKKEAKRKERKQHNDTYWTAFCRSYTTGMLASVIVGYVLKFIESRKKA